MAEVRIKRSWILEWLWLRPFGFVAVTFGHVIFVRSDYWPVPKCLMAHELCYVRQWERYGKFGFLARYLYYYFRYACWRSSHYYDNPLEAEALAASEAETCKAN